VLGPEAREVISEVVLLQDHLGDLNDADVANAMLSRFLFSTADTAKSSIIAPGVVSYLAYRQRELESLVKRFPPVWAHFNRSETKYQLANALAAL
jgi:CHAD domain-containing protein